MLSTKSWLPRERRSSCILDAVGTSVRPQAQWGEPQPSSVGGLLRVAQDAVGCGAGPSLPQRGHIWMLVGA